MSQQDIFQALTESHDRQRKLCDKIESLMDSDLDAAKKSTLNLRLSYRHMLPPKSVICMHLLWNMMMGWIYLVMPLLNIMKWMR